MTEGLITVITTAPANYDYGYVVIIEECLGTSKGKAPKTYRKVAMPAHRVNYQCGRYGSGMHPAYVGEEGEAEWAKLVEYKLVNLPG